MMQYPSMSVYMDENNILCFSRALGPSEKPHLIFYVPPDELKEYKLEELEEKIGGTIVGMLKVLHPAPFANLKPTELAK